MKRGQGMMEFIVLAGFLLFVAVIAIVVFTQRGSQTVNDQERAELMQIATQLNQEVLTAYQVQDGYVRSFDVPATLHSGSYSINVKEGTELSLQSQNTEYVIFLPAQVLLNTTEIPQLSGDLIPGRIIVSKSNGKIYISQRPS
jgi:hypothetical protein